MRGKKKGFVCCLINNQSQEKDQVDEIEKKRNRSLFLLLVILLISQNLIADYQDEYSKYSLEDLLKIEIITVSKRAESVRDAPGMVSVVTRDEIERFGGTTLADILNRVPGLINVKGTFDSSIMAARGDSVRYTSTSRHVLLLIDGRPIREVQEGGIKTDVYNSFPVNAIDHIEVIKGPGSVLYGSEAYSAVINVVTLEAESNGAAIAGATSTENSSYVLGRADVSRSDFSMMVAARAARSDDWPVEYSFGSGPTEVTNSYDLRDRAKGVFFKSRYKGFKLLGSYMEHDSGFILPHRVSSFNDVHFERLFLDAGYTRALSEHWNLAANLTYNQSWLDSYIRRNSNELLGELTNIVTISDKVRLTIGGLMGRIDGSEKTTRLLGAVQPITQATRDNWALYGQVDYQVVGAARLTAGFQALKYENIDLTVVPRFGLVWNPSPRFNAKILYAEAFRAPYLNENFIALPGGIYGNKDLKPEMVESYEISLSYIMDLMELKMSYFKNSQTDIISYGYISDLNALRYFNVPGVEVQGFELEAKYYVNRSLFFTGSLLSQSVDDNELSGFADFGAKAGISYSSEIGTVSLFNVYQGSISESLYDPNSLNPEPGSYNLLSLHANLDISRLWKGRNELPKLMMFIQGDNLLDEEIWLPLSGGVIPSSVPYKRGRDVYAGFEVAF